MEFEGSYFFSVLTISGEKVLKFFWFDAYEDRFKQPGI